MRNKVIQINDYMKRYSFIIFIFFSFFVLDVYTRYYIPSSDLIKFRTESPNLFTLSWICFFIGIISISKIRIRKVLYVLLISFFCILFLINNIYYSVFNSFFSFKLFGLADEGVSYISSVLKTMNTKILLVIFISLVLCCLAIKLFPKDRKKTDVYIGVFFIVLSIIFYKKAIYFLGPAVDPLEWDSWNYKRNIYNSFSDTKKSLKVSGFYEYLARDIYISFFKKEIKNIDKDITYLDDYFNGNNELLNIMENNEEYKSIFKNKNVIIILMETIDSWMITEEIMPTVYNLMNNGINFSNHYAPIYGSGATFNSEFMINTGYMTPFNGGLPTYEYGDNNYKNSLANLFRLDNYTANNIHYNTGDFYNRKEMTKAFGYQNYYSGIELGYKNSLLDSNFMLEKELRDKIIPDSKFMSFYTTYSAHLPYSFSGGNCQLIKEKIDNASDTEELICIKTQANDTDKFFQLLLDSLEEKGIIDETVIIGITDHYNYGISDKNYLYSVKETSDYNLISNVPFFIWNKNINPITITKTNSNIDILPTLAYLFGLDYNPNHYIGQNIFDENYNGFVFFGDYSWYDGQTYYKDGTVISGIQKEKEYIINMNKKINNILDINKKVLETNYFGVR